MLYYALIIAIDYSLSFRHFSPVFAFIIDWALMICAI